MSDPKSKSKQPSSLDKLKGRMEEDPILFGRMISPPTFETETPAFHYKLVEAYLDKTHDRIVIVAPRGFAKTTIMAGVVPLHHLFCEAPGRRKVVVLVSKTQEHTVKLLDWIKNILEYSQEFRAMYGYHGSQSAKVWTRTEIILANGNAILCRGMGQMVVGLKVGERRPTLIVLDDPEDMNNTKTEEAMEHNLRWLLQSLVPSRDAKLGRVIVIGTPQHQRSLVMKLQEAEGWKCFHYQALYGDGPTTRANIENLTSLWPEQWPVSKLLKEKEILESIGRVSAFYREYMCQIIGDEDQLFRESYVRYWDGEYIVNNNGEAWLSVTHLNGEDFDEPQLIPINLFTGIDPASSVRRDADFSAIVNSGIDGDDNRYIVSYINQRLRPMDLAATVIQNFQTMKSAKTQIESVGYQEMLRDYLRRQSTYIPGLEIKNTPRTGKSNRLESIQPWFAGGKVYIKRGMEELVDQLLLYPRGAHDDILDGMYYSFKGMYKPYHTGGPTGEKKAKKSSGVRRATKSWELS